MRFFLHDFGVFNATRRIGPARWPHFDLLWFHSGRVRLRVGALAPVELRGGDGVLLFPDTAFEGEALSPTALASVQHFAVEAGDDLPAPLDKFRRGRSGCRLYRGFATSTVVPDIERAIQLAGGPTTAGLAQVRLLNLALILQLLENGPGTAEKSPGGSGVVAGWRKECRQRPLAKGTVAELGGRFGLSHKKLRATFAAQGLSPRRFLLETRMERARELLAGSDEPIKAIATAAGYADVVAFHRAFRGFHDATPVAYRQGHRRRIVG